MHCYNNGSEIKHFRRRKQQSKKILSKQCYINNVVFILYSQRIYHFGAFIYAIVASKIIQFDTSVKLVHLDSKSREDCEVGKDYTLLLLFQSQGC